MELSGEYQIPVARGARWPSRPLWLGVRSVQNEEEDSALETLRSLEKKYDFGSEVYDVLIKGRSIIDTQMGLAEFNLRTVADVDAFGECYGFNFNDPIEHAEILGNFHEALNFIRKHFLQPENPEGLKLEIPRKILELTDIRSLFLMAAKHFPDQKNDSTGLALSNWACSILRIMHTIAHIDKDVRTSYFSEVQKQIFDRFYRFIHRDEENRLYLGDKSTDPLRVDLVAFETKPKKSRESILMKLLHKPENVAEELFDRVGVRFITRNKVDCLRVVKFLKDQLIIMPANIKPSRSRNTLIDLDTFRAEVRAGLAEVTAKKIDLENFEQNLELHLPYDKGALANPHTSKEYKAIQFTCRQLIQIHNSAQDELKELKLAMKGQGVSEDLYKRLDRIDLKYLPREVRFFYPFEIQIVDQNSNRENERGRSSHHEYKRAQQASALKRVMRNFVES